MLPDLETLQDPFEIPAQLRLDMPQSAEATQGHSSRNLLFSAQHTQHQHCQADQSQKDIHCGPEQQAGHASGATTPSGPRSTASDESLHPGIHYTYGSMAQAIAAHGSDAKSADLSPARLAQSKSMPLLDDLEGLTELQQAAADMLADVSDFCCWHLPFSLTALRLRCIYCHPACNFMTARLHAHLAFQHRYIHPHSSQGIV